MARFLRGLTILCLSSTLQCQSIHVPLTQVAACRQFSNAVVEIQTERERGTGFISDPEGWIFTASHVVIDPKTGRPDSVITVILPDKSTKFAKLVPAANGIVRDFAILKIEQAKLPYLEFGDEDKADIGSAVTIIGFPFSVGVSNKFCLSGTVAARDTIQIGKVNVEGLVFQVC